MEFEDQLNRATQGAIETLEKIGVHTTSADVGSMPKDPMLMLDSEFIEKMESSSPQELFESGDMRFMIRFTAKTTDRAFSDKVLNPDIHELDQEFRFQLPTETEAQTAAMIDDLQDLEDDLDD